jgi:hypothetical protein
LIDVRQNVLIMKLRYLQFKQPRSTAQCINGHLEGIRRKRNAIKMYMINRGKFYYKHHSCSNMRRIVHGHRFHKIQKMSRTFQIHVRLLCTRYRVKVCSTTSVTQVFIPAPHVIFAGRSHQLLNHRHLFKDHAPKFGRNFSKYRVACV